MLCIAKLSKQTALYRVRCICPPGHIEDEILAHLDEWRRAFERLSIMMMLFESPCPFMQKQHRILPLLVL